MELPEELLFEKQDGVAILTLNRPEKFNALNPNLRDGIGRVCREVSRDDEVRVMTALLAMDSHSISPTGKLIYCSAMKQP